MSTPQTPEPERTEATNPMVVELCGEKIELNKLHAVTPQPAPSAEPTAEDRELAKQLVAEVFSMLDGGDDTARHLQDYFARHVAARNAAALARVKELEVALGRSEMAVDHIDAAAKNLLAKAESDLAAARGLVTAKEGELECAHVQNGQTLTALAASRELATYWILKANKAEAALAERDDEAEQLRAYVGGEIFRSDFQTAAQMRAALEEARAELARLHSAHREEMERERKLADRVICALRIENAELKDPPVPLEVENETEASLAAYLNHRKRQSATAAPQAMEGGK